MVKSNILLRILAAPVFVTFAYMCWNNYPVLAGLCLGNAIDAAVGAGMLWFKVKHPTCGACA